MGNENKKTADEEHVQKTINIAIRIGFIALLFVMSYLILKPFIGLVLWAIIIAVALFPLHKKFSVVLGNREKLSATLIVLGGITLMLIPTILFTASAIDSAQGISDQIDAGTLSVPAPDKHVADWPIIGKTIYGIWDLASKSITDVFELFEPQIKEYAPKILSTATGIVSTVLLFIVSLVLSGALMVNSRAAEKTAKSVFKTLAGAEGGSFALLAASTIRGVVQGVIGTAFIQTFFISIGLFLIGFPGAEIVSLVVLFVAIIQLPLLLVILPIIIYVFSYAGTTAAVIFAVWSVLWGASDNVIKPILMGRGVDIPMLVILLGAIGGMVMGGIIGLFIGAVMLAFAYKVFQTIIQEN
jgi:predicted PurR-regulated permease PerM